MRVDRATPDAARLAAALRHVGAEGCYLYSPDPVDAATAVAYARFFNPTVGIAEDPATGTAAGPLAAKLVAAGQVPDQSTVIIEQGHALGRPSRIAVSVWGQAFASVDPAWSLPKERSPCSRAVSRAARRPI
jgi:trans-2,3-dihydro-3-hydroxyanthranilate isomerase